MIFSDFLKFQTSFHKHLTFRLLTNNGLLKRPDFEKSSLIINQLRPNNSKEDETIWRMDSAFSREESVYLHTLKVDLPLEDIYRRAFFDA
jgi:hypothetical protein